MHVNAASSPRGNVFVKTALSHRHRQVLLAAVDVNGPSIGDELLLHLGHVPEKGTIPNYNFHRRVLRLA